MFKIISNIEKQLLDIVFLVVFIPKTYLKIATERGELHKFIHNEMRKEPEEQFINYSPPLLYWCTVGVIPLFFIFHHVMMFSAGMEALSSMMGVINADTIYNHEWWTEHDIKSNFYKIIFLLLSTPVAFSTMQSIIIDRKFTRKSIEKYLSLNFYTLGAFWLTLSLIIFIYFQLIDTDYIFFGKIAFLAFFIYIIYETYWNVRTVNRDVKNLLLSIVYVSLSISLTVIFIFGIYNVILIYLYFVKVT